MFALDSLKYIHFGNIHRLPLRNKLIEDRKIGYTLVSNRS